MLSVSKSVQHFARLVTKLYMELVREFDISQQKVNHSPIRWYIRSEDGPANHNDPYYSSLYIFKCIIIYYLKVVSHKWHGNTYT